MARSRHPTAQKRNADYDLLDPDEYLEMNKNGNTKKTLALQEIRTIE